MGSRRTRTCARPSAIWHAPAPSTPRRGRRCSRPRRRWRSAPATSPARSRATPADKETSMAHKRDDDQSSNVSEIVGLLVRAADGDTLVRDLYLLRARAHRPRLFGVAVPQHGGCARGGGALLVPQSGKVV